MVETTRKLFPTHGQFKFCSDEITIIASDYVGRNLHCCFCFSYRHLPAHCSQRPTSPQVLHQSTTGRGLRPTGAAHSCYNPSVRQCTGGTTRELHDTALDRGEGTVEAVRRGQHLGTSTGLPSAQVHTVGGRYLTLKLLLLGPAPHARHNPVLTSVTACRGD